MPDELTLGEFLCGILPRLRDPEEEDLKKKRLPQWPPDCFALALSVLKRTGGYVSLFSVWPKGKEELSGWVSAAQQLGQDWRKCWISRERSPEEPPFAGLDREWDFALQSFDIALGEAANNVSLCRALFKLAAVADEASKGAGSYNEESSDFFDFAAWTFLSQRGTLCDEVDSTRVRVLPRMHTPQSGLTERALSLYLSLHEPSEVTPKWLNSPVVERETLNLLLVPWPFEVLVRQFRDVNESALSRLPDGFGFFTFDVERSDVVSDLVADLYNEAKRGLGQIDGVILPEMALSMEQFRALREKLPGDCVIVSGVGQAATAAGRNTNEVRFSFPPLTEISQKKHHPWKLDQSQTIQYGLGAVLSPFIEWWEYADFTDRHLHFIAIGTDMLLAVLICEDLARPDPVANLLRSVGPNLVLALLMDGPQTRERWGARYATVLAEDPGCSVLVLTSRGMMEKSRPASGIGRPRAVAIWKDRFGLAEIDLPEGCDAVAISLSVQYKKEYAADGRARDDAAYPVLSGIHPIKGPTRPK